MCECEYVTGFIKRYPPFTDISLILAHNSALSEDSTVISANTACVCTVPADCVLSATY